MTPSQSALARENGINSTAHKFITKIEKDWDTHLGTGRDFMWVTDELMQQVEEVRTIVENHFLKLGYGFQLEYHANYYHDTQHYCMRIVPRVQSTERGVFSRLLNRLFGGAHV